MKIFIGGGVKTKPILQKEWAFLFFAPDDLRLRPNTSRFTIKDIGFGLRKNWNKDDLENRT